MKQIFSDLHVKIRQFLGARKVVGNIQKLIIN